jgi:ABC-type amino acid transport system permease subunit
VIVCGSFAGSFFATVVFAAGFGAAAAGLAVGVVAGLAAAIAGFFVGSFVGFGRRSLRPILRVAPLFISFATRIEFVSFIPYLVAMVLRVSHF